MHVCMYVCMHVCMYVGMYVCVYVCCFMYVCMHVCLFKLEITLLLLHKCSWPFSRIRKCIKLWRYFIYTIRCSVAFSDSNYVPAPCCRQFGCACVVERCIQFLGLAGLGSARAGCGEHSAHRGSPRAGRLASLPVSTCALLSRRT